MKIEDIRSKTDSELEFERAEAKKNLFGLRLKASTESLADSAQIRVLRRDIAKINTVLHERANHIRGQESR
ncbi:MAG: 50S ribosomal protein L29 [Planctomycetes bacterium]|nr:50S ribosomal protein L29 [Planctomycetota bacterium]